MHLIVRILFLSTGLLLTACTPLAMIEPGDSFNPQTASLEAEQAHREWWQLRFTLNWPADEQPDFSRHLLIAEQLLRPVIVEHQDDLALWRFHRRAGRDNAGHQFSLIFLTDETSAAQIGATIEASPLSSWLRERGMIDRTLLHQRSPEQLGELELTSDPSWPIEIQRSWPYFIMGASQSWLMLVQELSAEDPLGSEIDYPALLDHYRIVDAKLTAQWRDFGQHAYLHHLSAIFGYQPIRIRSNDLKAF